jgi:hypothetical protein
MSAVRKVRFGEVGSDSLRGAGATGYEPSPGRRGGGKRAPIQDHGNRPGLATNTAAVVNGHSQCASAP